LVCPLNGKSTVKQNMAICHSRLWRGNNLITQTKLLPRRDHAYFLNIWLSFSLIVQYQSYYIYKQMLTCFLYYRYPKDTLPFSALPYSDLEPDSGSWICIPGWSGLCDGTSALGHKQWASIHQTRTLCGNICCTTRPPASATYCRHGNRL